VRKLRALALTDPKLDQDLFDHLAALRLEMETDATLDEDIDLALWAGDFDRIHQLEESRGNLYPDALDLADLDTTDPWDQGDATGMPAEFDLPPDPFRDLAKGVPGALDALLASGGNLNLPGGLEQRSALCAALQAPGRSVQTLQRLIAAGADPRLVPDEGEDILAWAIPYDHYATVTPDSEARLFDLLVALGGDPDGFVMGYGCCLTAAIIVAGPPQVAALLRAGAATDVTAPFDFNIPDLAGCTPLMLAAPKPEVLRLLIDHGLLPTEGEADGETALDFILAKADLALERARSTRDPWHARFADALGKSREIILDWVRGQLALAEASLDAKAKSED
jgi:hypothetical protein